MEHYSKCGIHRMAKAEANSLFLSSLWCVEDQAEVSESAQKRREVPSSTTVLCLAQSETGGAALPLKTLFLQTPAIQQMKEEMKG